MAALDADLLASVLGGDGQVRAERLAERLRITGVQLAAAAGLSHDAISEAAQLASPATQARLRDVVEILNRVRPWAGSDAAAFAWYRSQPLPGFGNFTAEDLVKQGRTETVKRYLDQIAAGGHA